MCLNLLHLNPWSRDLSLNREDNNCSQNDIYFHSKWQLCSSRTILSVILQICLALNNSQDWDKSRDLGANWGKLELRPP